MRTQGSPEEFEAFQSEFEQAKARNELGGPDMPNIDLNDVFSLRRPKHIGSG